MPSVTMTVELRIYNCPACGVPYGISTDLDDACRSTGKSYYCPNGHSLSYGASEAEKLRRERDVLKQQIARVEDESRIARAQAEEQRRQRISAEKKLKTTQTRIGAGVCPCCNRSVSQLARHMHSKHPDVAFVPAAPKPKAKVRT